MGTDNGDSDIARDFREQQQEIYRDKKDQLERAREELLPKLLEHLRTFTPTSVDPSKLLADALNNSDAGPSDEPLTHRIVVGLCQRIESAAKKVGMPLHGGVSAGSILKEGVEATQQRVMTTNASIVLVTPTLLLLCNRVAKLMARTVGVSRDEGGIRVAHELDESKEMFRQDRELFADWMRLFCDLAFDPNSPSLGRTYALSGDRRGVWIGMLEAMELFAIGHEYGHHVAMHGSSGSISVEDQNTADQHSKEIEADFLGAILAAQAGLDSPVGGNPYAASGSGAVVLLTVFDLGRRGHQILLSGGESPPSANSHPELSTRLEAVNLAMCKALSTELGSNMLRLRSRMTELLEFVWHHASHVIKAMHEAGARPRSVGHDWLPGR